MNIDGVAKGMVAGAVGVAAMTAAEKVEQRFTGRPDSYVPGRTLGHLLRLPKPSSDRLVRNHVMHWGTGIVLGGVRGAMATRGLRGVGASALHTLARLSTDQTLENLTGVGAPPWTWPRQELVVDIGHKAVYGFVTGWVADRLLARSDDAAAPAARIDTPAEPPDERVAVPVTGTDPTDPVQMPNDVVVNASPS